MKKLLHFTADWCAPCKKMKPLIEEFAAENTDIEYIQINVDVDFDVAEEYEVMSIPTLIAIDNNLLVGRFTGLADKAKIEQLFK